MKVKNISLTEEDILSGINARKSAREAKDWAKADAVRKELEEKALFLKTEKDGTGWKVRI